MKQIILACLLATSGASAFAEWTYVTESSDGTIFYIDFQSIRNDGNLRKVWIIQDIKQRDKDGEMSSRLRFEFNCKEERNRILAISTHTGRMAGGKTLFTGGADPMGWNEIPPNTPFMRILKIVCAK